MCGYIFINGKMAADNRAMLSVKDRGFLYGDGLYETMKSFKGSVFMVDDHIYRLLNSMKVLRYNLTFDKEYINEAIKKTIARNNLDRTDAFVKAIVTRGIHGAGLYFSSSYRPSLIVIAEKIASQDSVDYKEGVKIISSSIRRPSMGNPLYPHKLINYFENIYAKDEAKRNGAKEAIFLTKDHLVLEGASSNIFYVKGNTVFTPPLTQNILPGITRKVVICLCRENGIKVKERKVHYRDFIRADEIFKTSSIAEIVPVNKVDRFEIYGKTPGDITAGIIKLYSKKTVCGNIAL